MSRAAESTLARRRGVRRARSRDDDRRISLRWTMIRRINDTPADATATADLLQGDSVP
jgi:adenine C2-methylase RlmN of 23S rRNA A2503 and tRNA A37